jgi:hypothetical protein
MSRAAAAAAAAENTNNGNQPQQQFVGEVHMLAGMKSIQPRLPSHQCDPNDARPWPGSRTESSLSAACDIRQASPSWQRPPEINAGESHNHLNHERAKEEVLLIATLPLYIRVQDACCLPHQHRVAKSLPLRTRAPAGYHANSSCHRTSA